MKDNELIKKYIDAANVITISQMYLTKVLDNIDLNIDDIKSYNPGHLGTSMSINFILANLNYFLNKNNLSSQLVVGTGHAGVSLASNLWMDGTLEKYNKKYSRNKEGLNNLIHDFGTNIRSEINPQYPHTIYDGGELGYSLGVSYGYAIDSNVDIVPCIIGDGEAETGSLCSSYQLNRMLKIKSKVLPIINLNGLKMCSKTYLSLLNDEELKQYFSSLKYNVEIVDTTNKTIFESIDDMQCSLQRCLKVDNPIIIFRSKKGYTLPNVNNIVFEDNKKVHKNPLQSMSKKEKLLYIREILKKYNFEIFDSNDNLLTIFKKFEHIRLDIDIKKINNPKTKIDDNLSNIQMIEKYLISLLKSNSFMIFSPDEINSNMLSNITENTFEMLNENLLQALYQGYIEAGNFGFYISYEGFMPIISSMVSQYYKHLNQKNNINNNINSLNYILTSTCFENTYSHQNPDIVNTLYEKDDYYYNIFYPKDGNNALKCIEYCVNTNNKINMIITSKRHLKKYQKIENTNIEIETLIDCNNPDIILCATGDYMLDQIYNVYNDIRNKYKIKLVYVTKPQILCTNSYNSLSEEDFNKYFNREVPIIYLFSGYSYTIKSLIYERNINCMVVGYQDSVSKFGNLENTLISNSLDKESISKLCIDKINVKNNEKKLRLI